MKYKYVLSKDNDTNQFIIREHAELSKEIFSTVCEANFDIKQVEEALAGGYEEIAANMRTQHFFPPSNFLERIAQGASELIAAGEQNVMEIYCDDTEFLTKSLDGTELFEKIDDDEDEGDDDFIDDDLPDDFDGDVKPSVTGASIDVDDGLEDEDD